MSDLDDFDLDPTVRQRALGEPESEPPPPLRRGGFPAGPLAAALVVLVAGGIGGYLFLRRTPPAATASPTPQPTAAAPAPSPAAPGLPAVDQSDALFRELARSLSSHPQLAVWLGVDGLVRRIVSAVEEIGDGASPRAHVGFLAPTQPFRVIQRRGRLVVDPKSYARYDAFAAAFASLDAPGCAHVYGRLEPLFEAAYRDLGHPEGGFRPALGRAFDVLLATPVPPGEIAVRGVMRGVLVYEYEEASLEGLSAAQKQLLRLGPANVRKVQSKLRELAAALTAPASSSRTNSPPPASPAP